MAVEEQAAIVVEAARRWYEEQGDNPVLDLSGWSLWSAVNEYNKAHASYMDDLRRQLSHGL